LRPKIERRVDKWKLIAKSLKEKKKKKGILDNIIEGFPEIFL
jgi:hypothetical protein